MHATICNAYASVNKYELASKFNALHNIDMQIDPRPRDDDEVITFIRNIIAHRKTHHTDLAKTSDVSQSTLSRILEGKTKSPGENSAPVDIASSSDGNSDSSYEAVTGPIYLEVNASAPWGVWTTSP